MDDTLRLIRDAEPALVILDLVMRTQEAGVDILRAMRASAAPRNVPVLLMTANHACVRAGREMRSLEAEVMTKLFTI